MLVESSVIQGTQRHALIWCVILGRNTPPRGFGRPYPQGASVSADRRARDPDERIFHRDPIDLLSQFDERVVLGRNYSGWAGGSGVSSSM